MLRISSFGRCHPFPSASGALALLQRGTVLPELPALSVMNNMGVPVNLMTISHYVRLEQDTISLDPEAYAQIVKAAMVPKPLERMT